MTTVERPQQTTSQAQCPVDHTTHSKMHRLESRPDSVYTIEDNGSWTFYDFEVVRSLLRHTDTRQNGLGAPQAREAGINLMKNQPILFLEGEEHHRLRRETNRFFTPKLVDTEHREMMHAFADDLMARLQRDKRVDLSDLSMDMAVNVAAEIVGLTDSWFKNGMKSRLDAMIATGDLTERNAKPTLIQTLRAQMPVAGLFVMDVLPAIRERKKNPKDDIITYLISKDYSPFEILTECLVYGTAGMVTTREFIQVVMLHLFDNPRLMERMKVGSEEERYAILNEILRIEPVVAYLYRETTAEITLEVDGQTITIPENTALNLSIYAANTDEQVMGEHPQHACPMREMADIRPKAQAMGLSFGDGIHRCVGAYVAIQETDIFINKLLNQPGLKLEKKPDISYAKVIESYELRDFIIEVD